MVLIERVLREIDGRGYGAYRRLVGARQVVDGVAVEVVRVQGDPYAPPSVARVELVLDGPSWALRHPVAYADWVLRRLFRELKRVSRRVGEGWSGFLGVPKPSPVMIRRSAVEVRGSRLVARVWVGLPSRRRRVLGDEAIEILLRKLPRAVARAASWRGCESELRRYVDAWIEQEYIRELLPRKRLVAFVGDGSILPRKHGGSEEPLEGAVPFESPPSLRIEIELPTGRTVSGAGIPRGLTVVTGAAFHGKTTLIEAIAAGVYNHVPRDGRELVVSLRDTVLIASEEGRFVTCVDISPFIDEPPPKMDPRCFSTRDASGATSVAASIQEAIEVGAKLILLDEDTVATNVLFEDLEIVERLYRARTVVPLPSLAQGLESFGVSIIVASSGHRQLLRVAKTVISMLKYIPRDVTEECRELARDTRVAHRSYSAPRERILARAPRLYKPRVRGCLLEDRELDTPINLCSNAQLYEETQLNTLRVVAKILPRFEGASVAEIARRIERTILSEGFEALLGKEPGPDLGEVRAIDVAYLINRMPIEVIQR